MLLYQKMSMDGLLVLLLPVLLLLLPLLLLLLLLLLPGHDGPPTGHRRATDGPPRAVGAAERQGAPESPSNRGGRGTASSAQKHQTDK